MKPYNHEEAVVVGIEVRKHGRTRVREDRYRKSRGLKSVTFTLGTDSPTPATGRGYDCPVDSHTAAVTRPRGGVVHR